MRKVALGGLLAAFLLGCGPSEIVDTGRGDVEGGFRTLEGADLADELSGSPVQQAPIAFVRLGALWDADRPTALEIATSVDGTSFSAWSAINVVHSETEETSAFAGVHVVDGPAAQFYKLRPQQGAPMPTFLRLEFMAESLSASIEDGEPGFGLDSIDIAVGTVDVNPRSAWGARAPRCVSNHSPYRMAIHHTTTPTNDTISPEARLRQMQSYHQDVKGWCDIGYHFLVSRDGRLWQGRPSSRIGSHTGGSNTGNIGIAFMGNHTSTTITAEQLDNTGGLIAGLAEEYGITINRINIKGHREYKSTACPGDALFGQLGALLDRARLGPPEPPPPPPPMLVTVKGILYVSGDTSMRIGGATVTLGPRTTTSSGTGFFQFADVEQGQFTVTASAADYVDGTITRSTSSSDTTWASFGLSTAPKTGTLQGVVYHGGNSQNRVGGATILLSDGLTVTADANGFYKIVDLPVGDYNITASNATHAAVTTTRTIVGDQVTWGSIDLN